MVVSSGVSEGGKGRFLLFAFVEEVFPGVGLAAVWTSSCDGIVRGLFKDVLPPPVKGSLTLCNLFSCFFVVAAYPGVVVNRILRRGK